MRQRQGCPRSLVSLVFFTLFSQTPAIAQSQTSQPPVAPPPPAADVRPAATTFFGDTGLWYVPSGEILPARKWSISAYRLNFDDNQGFSDVSNWPVTFAFGVRDRAA